MCRVVVMGKPRRRLFAESSCGEPGELCQENIPIRTIGPRACELVEPNKVSDAQFVTRRFKKGGEFVGDGSTTVLATDADDQAFQVQRCVALARCTKQLTGGLRIVELGEQLGKRIEQLTLLRVPSVVMPG